MRFSGDSIKSCIGFFYLGDSTKNIMTMEGLEYISKYYSTFINSISNVISSSNGKVIKILVIVYYFNFLKSNDNNLDAFREVIDCGSKILNDYFQYRNNKNLN